MSRTRTLVTALVAAPLLLLGLVGIAAAASDPRPATDEYFTQMADVLSYATSTDPYGGQQPATARAQVDTAAAGYRDLLARVDAIVPPREQRDEHRAYRQALRQNLDAYLAIARTTPSDAPFAQWPAYGFADPRLGYAFGTETQAQCGLARAAAEAGVTDFPSRQACDEGPVPTGTVGTPEAPVNDVTIVHEPACDSRCPNLVYAVSSITARAGQLITLTFDNRNPLPFLFNLAVYEGDRPRLVGRDQVAFTAADGPKVHTLTLTLEPGTYTYADNVHPYSVRGTLTVVP